MWKYRKGRKSSFVELNAKQRTPPWDGARKDRLTASIYESVLGLSRFSGSGKIETIERMMGLRESKPITEAMQLGIINEDPLRNWYSDISNSKITEPSLCLGLSWYDFPMSWNNNMLLSKIYPSQLSDPLHPNWFIGGSPDGEVYFEDGLDANLEIKFTKKLYTPLDERLTEINSNIPKFRYGKWSPSLLCQPFQCDIRKYFDVNDGVIDFFPHIWRSHFMQMQGCMALLGRSQCVYLVGTPTQKYVEMIPFDERYWRCYLYPNLVEVVETEIKPRMSKEHKQKFADQVKDIIKTVPKHAEIMYKW